MLCGTEIESSPELIQEFLGNSSGLAADMTPNNAWHFENQSSGELSFNGNVYFLAGDVAFIQSSPPLSLNFQTGVAYLSASNSPTAAWYFDAGTNALSPPFNANVYFLNGSIDSITSSPLLSLSFNGSFLSLATAGTTHAWYYDNFLPSDLNANIYYLNGAIDGVTHSSLTSVSFLGNSPSLVIDSNSTASWYYDSSLATAGSDYNGKVYYLIGSDSGIESSSGLTCTFQSTNAFLISDVDQNTAWYGDTGNISGTSSATAYYLQGDTPNIGESHRSFDFSVPYVSIVTDKKADAAWYYNYFSDTIGFSGRVYYLEGSSIEIESSPSASYAFQTQDAGFLQSGTENRGWYFDRGFISSPGFEGNIYYLNSSLSGISSTTITLPFQTQYTDLIIGKNPDTAWYVDLAKDSTTAPFPCNVYYLSGSTEAISSSGLTLTFNTNSQFCVLDPSSGGLWYADFGGLGTGFDGKIYYLSGSSSGISSVNTTAHFSSNYATLTSAGPSAVWYYNQDSVDNSVYYIKVNPGSLSIHGWTSGTQGALLNSVFNTMLAPIKTMHAQASRRNSFSKPNHLSFDSVFSEANLFVDARDFPTYSNNDKEKISPYLFQIIPFYDFIYQKNQGSIPDFNNNIAGALTTFDAKIDPFIIGGGVAYTYNHAHLTGGLGHININQEVGTVYSSWQNERFFIGSSLWGGFYQLKGVRETAGQLTSHYSTQGYTLTPHVELKAFSLSKESWLAINPFIMGDWIVLWQKSYNEKGIQQTSIETPSEQVSLLRTEVGLYI
ncbi:MAG TPA: autotransporter outer membrane beta-barrel domain-containing protein, partial [Chlamydiales bacterium]|nr:autotransporter outer membrane beta-barrel domain-containing protein [Chlamydiales bacterium]